MWIRRGMDKKYYAHTLDGKPPSDWQPLEEHMKNVVEIARSFPMLLMPAKGSPGKPKRYMA
jgi:hypothetical protein